MSISLPKKYPAILALLSVLFAMSALAQDPSNLVTIGERLELESKVMGEQREVLIGKPATYGIGEESYPVLYVLDGYSHFHHIMGLTRFLARQNLIPELIVVGIPNTDRFRDLLPPSKADQEIKQFPTHGGASDFLQFIDEELISWVDQNYRTRPYKILLGHSFGGLFTVNTLLTNPEVFNAYIAISPSLQWNNQELVTIAEDFFDSNNELELDLYITAANEGSSLLGGIRKLAGILDEKAPQKFSWDFKHFPEENHGSVTHLAAYQGLEFIFDDWFIEDYMTIFDRDGIESLEVIYTDNMERFGYEGGIPDRLLGEIFGQLVNTYRLGEAVEFTSRYPEQFLADAFMYEYLAAGFAGNDQPEEAIEYYRKSLQVEPDNDLVRQALEALEANQ